MIILDKISFNNELEAFIKYNNKKHMNEDSKKYIINVDPVFNDTLYDRKGAIEKMSQVQLVLDKDKIYKRTVLK
jgi:AAA15 family ATPase/GTPase